MSETAQQQQQTEVQELSQEVINRLATEIVGIERANLILTNTRVGQAVLDHLYEGSLDIWNTRNVGDTAFARLSTELQNRQTAWTPLKLYRAVRTREQEVAFGSFDPWPNLTVSHFHAVQGLDWNKQRELLDAAQAHRHSVRDLQAAAKQSRGITPRSPTETAAAEASQVLRRFHKLFDERDELTVDLGEAGIAESSIRRFEEALEQFQAEVEALSTEMKSLGRSKPSPETPA